MKNIKFFKAHIDKLERELIEQALCDSESKFVNSFEDDIKNFFSVKHAVATNNGTNAIHLALCAMDIKRGDKIICSVNSFPNIASCIRQFDAEPILVDIDTNSFNISPTALEKAVKVFKHKKLKCAFITHVGGLSADMDEIYEIANSENIKIIDDASRAMGATYKGKKIGSIKNSYISCFQINPQAQDAISTAGFFTTNDDDIAKQAFLLRNNGFVSDDFDKDGNLKYIYDIKQIGHKFDINSINAAYAKAQLAKTNFFIKRRAHIAKIYTTELCDCPHITLPVAKDEHIYSQYIIKVDKNRDDFAREMIKNGINVSLHYIPIHLLSYYKKKYGYKVNDFPNALKVYQQILSLPIYAALSDDEVYYICKTVKEIASKRV